LNGEAKQIDCGSKFDAALVERKTETGDVERVYMSWGVGEAGHPMRRLTKCISAVNTSCT